MLLFDQDCGFCRWSVSKVLAWDRRRLVRAVPLQSAEAERILADVTFDRRRSSWHLVDRNGQVFSGGDAVPRLASLLPGGTPIAIVTARMPRTTDRIYRFIARHRDRLGRALHADACDIDER